MQGPTFTTFTPAFDAHYLARPQLEKVVWRALEHDTHAIVRGPRRSGKTSLLYRIAREGEAQPKRWTSKKAASVLLLDAQAPDCERLLSRKLAALLPVELRPPDTFLVGAYRTDDALILRHIDALIHALNATGREILLLIDEVDLPLRGPSPELWRRVLERLFRPGPLRLVVTTDALNIDEFNLSIPAAHRVTQLEMTPWDAHEIQTLIERTFRRERPKTEVVAAITKILAPAWPLEVTLLLRHLIEDGIPDSSELSSLLEERELTDYGVALLDMALSRLDRNDTRIAINLLTAVAKPDVVANNTLNSQQATELDNMVKSLPVARVLVRAGVLAIQGRLIAAATPTMLRAVRHFVGL